MTERTLCARTGAAVLTAVALLLPMPLGFSDPLDESLQGLVNNPPRYVIEYMKFAPDSLVQGTGPYGGTTAGSRYYRITARGEGVDTVTQVILESTYSKRSH